MQGLNNSPLVLSDSHARKSPNKEEESVIQASALPATSSATARCQLPSKSAQAASAWSDGGSLEGLLQRSPTTISPWDNSLRITTNVADDAGKPPFSQVSQKFFSPLPRISEIAFVNVGQRFGQGSLGGTAARQVGREDASAARAKEPDARNALSQIPATFAKAMPNPTLTMRPGSGLGTSSPAGADIQGPSPMDYSLEIEVEFLAEMVIEMRGNAVQKARRTIIGRTLRGRTTFKALYEYLKLHLLVLFTSATLLTRGYFLILFENEEGAISTRKLTTVEWSKLSLSSRYTPNFDASAQGVWAMDYSSTIS